MEDSSAQNVTLLIFTLMSWLGLQLLYKHAKKVCQFHHFMVTAAEVALELHISHTPGGSQHSTGVSQAQEHLLYAAIACSTGACTRVRVTVLSY